MKVNIQSYIKKHIPNSIGAKLICIDNKLLYKLLFLKVKIVLRNLLNGFLHNKKELIK